MPPAAAPHQMVLTAGRDCKQGTHLISCQQHTVCLVSTDQSGMQPVGAV